MVVADGVKISQSEDECIGSTQGAISKQIAGVFFEVPFLPPSAKATLADIATGVSQEHLASVPGFGLVLANIPCACGVVYTGLNIGKLKELAAKSGKAISSCKNVLTGVGEDVAKASLETAKEAEAIAKQALDSLQDAVSSVVTPVTSCFGFCGGGGGGKKLLNRWDFYARTYRPLEATTAALEDVTTASIVAPIDSACRGYYANLKYGPKELCDQILTAFWAVHNQKHDEYKKIQFYLQTASTADFYKLAQIYNGRLRCGDYMCLTGIVKFANARAADMLDKEYVDSFGGSTTDLLNSLNSKYVPLMNATVLLGSDRDTKRFAAMSKIASAAGRRLMQHEVISNLLKAGECESFLGRTDDYLCLARSGFSYCSVVANASPFVKTCRNGITGDVVRGASKKLLRRYGYSFKPGVKGIGKVISSIRSCQRRNSCSQVAPLTERERVALSGALGTGF
jgi:hypothetical protein